MDIDVMAIRLRQLEARVDLMGLRLADLEDADDLELNAIADARANSPEVVTPEPTSVPEVAPESAPSDAPVMAPEPVAVDSAPEVIEAAQAPAI